MLSPTDTALLEIETEIMAAKMAQEMGAPGSQKPDKSVWPDVFVNRDRQNKIFTPHNALIAEVIGTDTPRWLLVKGGEGGGKSVVGIMKTFGRLRRGCDGIMLSPDFQHLKRSLWAEFRRWCPPEVVVPGDRYQLNALWEPGQGFELHFYNDVGTISTLYCGGIADPTSWEGPNVNFVHFDEARRVPKSDAIKILDGRVRIPGPNGEPSQLYLTTTPRKHWLFTYFGGVEENEVDAEDPKKPFKDQARVITMPTRLNAANLEEGYVENRAASFDTDAERRVHLEAAWEDDEDAAPYLPNISWWDSCLEPEMPIATKQDGLVIALDAAVSRDCFGLIAVSVHPTKPDCIAVQAVKPWIPTPGHPLDYMEVEAEIRKFVEDWSVLKIVYDPYQLHQMAGRLSEVAWLEPFPQGPQRQLSDRALLDTMKEHKVWHRGDKVLRQHLMNADRKTSEDRKLRIVKREEKLKIDLAVCLSMACFAAQEYVSTNTGYVALGNESSGSAIDALLRA